MAITFKYHASNVTNMLAPRWFKKSLRWAGVPKLTHTVQKIQKLGKPLCVWGGILCATCRGKSHVMLRGGHGDLFFKSAIEIPQFEGSTSAIAILQLFEDMWLCNSNSGNPQLQFFLKSTTWELEFRHFWHIFGCGIRSIHGKKIEGKNLALLSL